MKRPRVLGWLLVLILLACAAVIFLDQEGMFGDSGTVSVPTTPTTTPSTPSPGTETPSTEPGYGDLQ